jgi:pyrimidine-nucleoside phosphorylase
MLNSGKSIDFKGVDGIIIDKHSTGGVGDRVSLCLSPICAALNINVAKLAGRGLGHTGGTIDKMESVDMQTELTREDYLKNLQKNGLFIMSQSDDIVSADKEIYALRNVTGTVQSLPLIASSVVSKKLALHTHYVFLDVKVGSGAFMENIKDAMELSKLMLNIFSKFKRKAIIHLTNMSQPLGRSIGNAIEMKATIDSLNGDFETPDFKSLIYDFVGDILTFTKKAKDKIHAYKMINDVINSKKALNIFYKWVGAQKGNLDKVKNNNFFKPKYVKEIKSKKSGYIKYKSAKEIGFLAFNLGAGRLNKTDKIDMQAGIYLNKVMNEYVNKNDIVATLYSSKPIKEEIIKRFLENVIYSKKKFLHEPMILNTIDNVKKTK